jgi:hypothetical protein
VPAQADDTVYFLDYTGPAGFPEEVAGRASQVIVLDHHKTAQETLVGRSDRPANLHIEIDMHRSGATIARDYFGSIKVSLHLSAGFAVMPARPVSINDASCPSALRPTQLWHAFDARLVCRSQK